MKFCAIILNRGGFIIRILRMNDFDMSTRPFPSLGLWHVPSLKTGLVRGFLAGMAAGVLLLALVQQF